MSVGRMQKQQHSISFSFQCLHTHILYLTYKEVYVGLFVVSYSRTYLWAYLDKTLQGDTGAPSEGQIENHSHILFSMSS